MNPRGFEDADIYGPLEEALQSGRLDAKKLLSGGTRLNCKAGTGSANYNVEGSKSVKIGTLRTTVEDGDCVWATDFTGDMPQYFDSDLEPMSEASVEDELRQQSFPAKSSWGPYDAISEPPAGSCMGKVADSRMYCFQTQSPSWVGFK